MAEPTFRDFPIKILMGELEDCERLIERAKQPKAVSWALTEGAQQYFKEVADESRADILKIAIIAKEFYDASQALIKKYNLAKFDVLTEVKKFQDSRLALNNDYLGV